MKNPFVKETSDSLWIGTLVTGLVSAGTLALIFYAKYAADKKAKAAAEQYHQEHAGDYLKPKPGKKHQSDIHDLASLTNQNG
jgi:hypothetical protein